MSMIPSSAVAAFTPAPGQGVVGPGRAALTAAACLFRGLGDPTRVAILSHLALGEHRVVDLTAHLGLAQSTVSTHLACLRDCGLVQSRPVGRASVFTLTAAPELLALLSAAEQILAVTGDAVVLCPTSEDSTSRTSETVTPTPTPRRAGS